MFAVILSVPRVAAVRPAAAPAIIKSMLAERNCDSKILDIELFEREFDLNLGEHELKIVHYGKTDEDHIYNPDGSIAVDKYVYIKRITIDKVTLYIKRSQRLFLKCARSLI